MGLLNWLFGPREPVTRWPSRGEFAVEVVGEANYQDALSEICGGRTEDGVNRLTEASLICEDSNPYDDMAVRVDVGGRTVGYLSRNNARAYRGVLERSGQPKQVMTCTAKIVGGWHRGRHDTGSFGVRLDLPAK